MLQFRQRMDEYEQVVEFRNRLVDYANLAVQYRAGTPSSAAMQRRLQGEKVWLLQAYGRLSEPLTRYDGPAQLRVPDVGIVSQDAVRDAIREAGGPFRGQIFQLAQDHLDMTLGRLQADAAQANPVVGPVLPAPDTIYRLTSLVYWLQRVFALIRWLVLTSQGRVTIVIGAILLALLAVGVLSWAETIIGVILLALLSAIVSGWAQGSSRGTPGPSEAVPPWKARSYPNPPRTAPQEALRPERARVG